MTKRRRRGATAVSDGPKTIVGVHAMLDIIQEAAKVHPRVVIYIMRKSATTGRLANIGREEVDTASLGDIETRLREIGGGGEYLIRPMRPDNISLLAEPLKNFMVSIEGAPKAATAREHGIDAAAGFTTMGSSLNHERPAPVANAPLTPEEYASLPEWMRYQPFNEQRSFLTSRQPGMVQQYNGQPPVVIQQQQPMSTKYTSDELAFKQSENYKSDLEALRKETTAREAKHEARLSELMQKLDDERLARKEAEHQGQLKALEAKLEAIANRPAPEPPKPTVDWAALVPFAAPFAGIVTTMITASNQRNSSLAEQQTKAFETQMNSVQAFLKQPQPQPQDPLKGLMEGLIKLSPILMPAVSEFFKNKSPQAQADLLSTMANNQLEHAAMIAQLLENLGRGSGSQEPWYMPLIQQVIGTFGTAAQAYAEAQRKMLPQQEPAHKLPANAGTAQQGGISENFTSGQEIAKLLMPNLPVELQTQEWFEIIGALHENELINPDHIAPRIADLLIGLENEDKIPKMIKEAYEKDAQGVLTHLFSNLPVGKHHPEYVNTLIAAIVKAIESAEEEEDGETAKQEATNGTAQATPATVPYAVGVKKKSAFGTSVS